MKIKSKETYIVIRELGFANIAIGAAALSVVFNTQWLTPVAIAGAIFFGAAFLQHATKRPATKLELIALISDFWIAAICLVFLGAYYT